jgi:transcriptional regulator with XRE-family HTH domain
MNANPILMTIRTKKLGVLIRDARLATGKTVEECAHAVGVSATRFDAFELGENPPTLPELELLAYTLKIPLDHFWGNELLRKPGNEISLDAEKVKSLRQKMIGALIRKARVDSGIILESLSEKTGIPLDNLKSYELGESAIPIPELEIISRVMDTSINGFQSQHGPLGRWLISQKNIKQFEELPAELQEFVCKPINQPYLELAVRLSEMSVEKLRALAEGLLEITL